MTSKIRRTTSNTNSSQNIWLARKFFRDFLKISLMYFCTSGQSYLFVQIHLLIYLLVGTKYKYHLFALHTSMLEPIHRIRLLTTSKSQISDVLYSYTLLLYLTNFMHFHEWVWVQVDQTQVQFSLVTLKLNRESAHKKSIKRGQDNIH